MASETRKRLDEQFPFNPNTEVLRSLRELVRAIEARLAPLDAQSQNYSEAVEQVRQIAIARLNEVLLPAYNELAALLETGIPSTKILDSGPFGRSMLATVSRPALMTLLDLKVSELDLNGGIFTSSHLVNATADTPPIEAAGRELLTAKWMRDLLAALNYAPQGSMASFTAGAQVLAPPSGDSSDRIPNTQWVRGAIAALVASAPATLDTLDELAAALGDDPNFVTTIATALGLKAPLASPTLTGTPTAPTAAAGTNTTQLATTAFVANAEPTRPGSAGLFFLSAAPAGWLKCNGAVVSRTTYAALFAVIGTSFGAGDGSTTFSLPDARGEFFRGLDDGRGVDPNRSVNSWQDGSMPVHSHETTLGMDLGSGQLTSWLGANGGGFYGYRQFSGAGAQIYNRYAFEGRTVYNMLTSEPLNLAGENRPRNIALLVCIKF